METEYINENTDETNRRRNLKYNNIIWRQERIQLKTVESQLSEFNIFLNLKGRGSVL